MSYYRKISIFVHLKIKGQNNLKLRILLLGFYSIQYLFFLFSLWPTLWWLFLPQNHWVPPFLGEKIPSLILCLPLIITDFLTQSCRKETVVLLFPFLSQSSSVSLQPQGSTANTHAVPSPISWLSNHKSVHFLLGFNKALVNLSSLKLSSSWREAMQSFCSPLSLQFLHPFLDIGHCRFSRI